MRIALPVARVEQTALDERNAHGLEVVPCDPPVLDERRVARAPGISPLDAHFTVPAEAVHRQVARRADGFDAANGPEAIDGLAEEGRLLLVRLVAVARDRDVEGHDPAGLDAGVSLLEQHQVLQQQSCPDQQRERQRDLGDDDSVAERRATACRARIGFANRRRERADSQPHHRPQSAEHADEGGDASGEGEHAAVDVHGVGSREQVGGEHEEDPDDPRREQQPQRAAREREDEGLARELTRDVAIARAKREANGQLAPTRETGGEQKVGDVRASDQQDEEDRAEENLERRSDVADDDFVVRPDVDAVVVAELDRERPAQRAHLRCRALQRDAFVETARTSPESGCPASRDPADVQAARRSRRFGGRSPLA